MLKVKDKLKLTVNYMRLAKTNTYDAEILGVYASVIRVVYRAGNRRRTSIALDSNLERTTNKVSWKAIKA
jgi:hypothetical protein